MAEALLSGVISGVVVSVVAFSGTVLTLRHSRSESKKDDQRALRNRHADRLRASLVPLVEAIWALWDFAIDHSRAPEKIHAAEYQANLRAHLSQANKAIVALSLEPEGEKYYSLFRGLDQHITQYRQQLDLLTSDEDGGDREKMRKHLEDAARVMETVRKEGIADIRKYEEII